MKYYFIFMAFILLSACTNDGSKPKKESNNTIQKKINCSFVLSKADSSNLLFNSFYYGMERELFDCLVDSLLNEGVLFSDSNDVIFDIINIKGDSYSYSDRNPIYYKLNLNETEIPLILNPSFHLNKLVELRLIDKDKDAIFLLDIIDERKFALIINLYIEKYGKPIFVPLQSNLNNYRNPRNIFKWMLNDKVIEISYYVEINRDGIHYNKKGVPISGRGYRMPSKTDTVYSNLNIIYTSKFYYDSIINNEQIRISNEKKRSQKADKKTKKDI